LLGAFGPSIPTHLRCTIEAWPDLPDVVKAGILAMIKAWGPGASR
jgi:hypothetical protein